MARWGSSQRSYGSKPPTRAQRMARAINFVCHYPPERLHALTAETVALRSGVPLTEAQKLLELARGRG